MKRKSYCPHGCPEEKEARCFATKPNGGLCLEPAVAVDPTRGCLVCERHRDEAVARLRREAGSAQLQPKAA